MPLPCDRLRRWLWSTGPVASQPSKHPGLKVARFQQVTRCLHATMPAEAPEYELVMQRLSSRSDRSWRYICGLCVTGNGPLRWTSGLGFTRHDAHQDWLRRIHDAIVLMNDGWWSRQGHPEFEEWPQAKDTSHLMNDQETRITKWSPRDIIKRPSLSDESECAAAGPLAA